MLTQSSTEVFFKHEYSFSLYSYFETKPSTTKCSGGFSLDQDECVGYMLKVSVSLIKAEGKQLFCR